MFLNSLSFHPILPSIGDEKEKNKCISSNSIKDWELNAQTRLPLQTKTGQLFLLLFVLKRFDKTFRWHDTNKQSEIESIPTSHALWHNLEILFYPPSAAFH